MNKTHTNVTGSACTSSPLKLADNFVFSPLQVVKEPSPGSYPPPFPQVNIRQFHTWITLHNLYPCADRIFDCITMYLAFKYDI